MTKKRLLSNAVWLLLIFLLVPLSVRAQLFELIPETEDWTVGNADGTTQSIRRPTHKIHFIMTPQAIDRSRIAQSLVWEFNERTSKSAAHSYMRARTNLHESINGQIRWGYQQLLAQIWDAAEINEVDTDFLTKITVNPVTTWNPFIFQQIDDDELSEEDRLAKRRNLFLSGVEQKHYDYARFSLREHPEQLEAVRQFVEASASAFRYLEEGSRCDFCDFGIPFRETNDPFGILIPEIQNMRDLARALSVKIMLEIHEKRYDDALQSIRVGMAMARHTGKQPCLVCGLVGIAIQSMMLEHVQEMINAPDCPNIYWEVSSLPYPFLQMIDSAEIEKQALPQSFPLLRKAMTDPDAVLDDEWRLMLRQMKEMVDQMNEDAHNNSPLSKLPIKSHVIASYPAARQWLLGQGKSVPEVEAMIPEKVVGLHTAYEIRLFYGENFRVAYLPLWEQYDEDEIWNRRDWTNNLHTMNVFSLRLTNFFLPAMQSARRAYQRIQLSNDIMRIAGALRDYAARHDGQLPESLDDITQVPVPMINPATGKAYHYQLIDGKGQIEALQLSPAFIVIFEIKK